MLRLLPCRHRGLLSIVLWEYLTESTSLEIRKQWGEQMLHHQWEVFEV